MSEQVQSEIQDGIALITLNRPPANALTPALRQGLYDATERMARDDGVRAIVLRGAGQGFSAGYDLNEFNGPLAAPGVAEICSLIEDCPKPVVAALHGRVLGGGFELALAAHARVVQRQARLGLQDVKIGLIPGAGATQRLPRLMGARGALELMFSGQAIPADDPRMKRVVTRLVDTDPVAAAIALAGELAQRGRWPRVRDVDTGFSDPKGYQSVIADVSHQLSRRDSAESLILKCVEAAQLLPFDRGLEFERALFEERLASAEARGLRHLLMVERIAAALPAGTRASTDTIRHVALTGEGDILADTAIAMLDAGMDLHLAMSGQAAIESARQKVERHYNTALARGRVPEDVAKERLSRLHGGGPASVAEADLLMDANAQPVTGLAPLKPSAICAVLWAGADAARRAEAYGIAGRGVSLWFPRPVQNASFAEYVLPPGTAPDVPGMLLVLFGRMGCSPVQTRAPAGQVSHRLGAALMTAAVELVSQGADPYAVDKAARAIGFAIPPFEWIDRMGLPAAENLVAPFRQRSGLEPSGRSVLVSLVTQGRAGVSSGRGFYLHSDGQAREDAALDPLLAGMTRGTAAAGMSWERLASALLGSLVQEAAALLQERMVRRASDLDLVLVKRFGFARARGGPLLQADILGIFNIYRSLQALTPVSAIWAPNQALETMVKNGNGFFGRSSA